MYKVYSKFNFPFTSLVEVWKDVPEWEECYEASSFGRIRSKDKIRHKMRMGKPTLPSIKGGFAPIKFSIKVTASLTLETVKGQVTQASIGS